MSLSIYVAVSENGVIGKENTLPWRLSADLKRLSAITKGHTVVMGRKTFESILARLDKPLPERKSIVITRQPNYNVPDSCVVAHTIDEALSILNPKEENFVFGGSEVYKLTLPYADKIYQTVVHVNLQGDAIFPTFNKSDWSLVQSENFKKDEKNEFDYSFLMYERKIKNA